MSAPETPERPANPWWIPRYMLGRVPAVEAGQIRLLGFVALALLFENYDFQILNAALLQIGEGLQIPEAELGRFMGTIRFGGVVGFLLIPLADRFGRRRLFLISVVGFSIGTTLTAFSQTPQAFVAFQLLSRAFMTSGAAVTYVIITEEFPAHHRGWGIGILGAVASMGHALGALLFAAIEVLPFGWRALYALGIVPIFLLPLFRRELRETARFERHRAERLATGGAEPVARAWFGPLRGLIRSYPKRLLGITLMGLLSAAGHAAVFMFLALFIQKVHGWAPWQYSTLFILCGAFGLVGNVVAGRLGDTVGRKRVAFVFLAGFPFASGLFYTGPAWSLPLAWLLLVFSVMGGNVTLRALATELFPTGQRGTASGWLFLMEALGAAAGLFAVTFLTPGPEFVAGAVITVSILTGLAAFGVLLLPETGRRDLEAISREELG